MGHPFFDAPSFPWRRKEATSLYDMLVSCISDNAEIWSLYVLAGGDEAAVTRGQPGGTLWSEVLKALGEAKEIKSLCERLKAIRRLKKNIEFQNAIDAVVNARAETDSTTHRALGPVQTLGLGLAGLASNPLDGFEQYLRQYVGTADTPAPFGGRHDELAALDRWLAEPGRPFALLVAGAGQGKSALLAHWALAVTEQDRADVVLVPVSIRFGTAAKRVALSILGARLRHLYGAGGDAPTDPDGWVREIGVYLRQPRPDGRPLLVVLDGADEAADWAVGKDLRLPSTIDENVKVLVSARLTAERDAAGWANALEWKQPTRISLGALGRDGVIEAVRSMGGAVADLADRDDVIDHLLRLSEGDPLMVGLWVEALWNAAAGSGTTITAEHMSRLEPGIGGFFKQWWEDQQEHWRLSGNDSTQTRERVEKFLYMCATALGPIFDEEAAAIGADLWNRRELKDIGASAARFVIGDGRQQGWVFSHPKLGQYFSEEVMFDADRTDFEARYLTFGRQTLDWLRADRPLLDRKTYGLRYYGAHLQRASADPRLACYLDPASTHPERFYELVTPAWQRAWEQLEGGYEGFLADVARAWDVADGQARQLSRTNGNVGRLLAQHVRLALVTSSIHSVATSLPPDMVIALVDKGIWTPAQAMAFGHRQPEHEQARTLARLAKLAPQLHREIRALAGSFTLASNRATTLVGLAASAGEVRLDILAEAIDDVATCGDPMEQDQAWRVLIPELPDPLLEKVASMSPAVTSARAELTIRRRSAEGMSVRSRGPLLDMVRAVIAEVDNGGFWAHFLPDLFALLAPDARRATAESALATMAEIADPSRRSRGLAALAKSLPDGLRQIAQAQSLDAARQIELSTYRGLAVVHVAPELDESLIPQALDALRSIGVRSGHPSDRGDSARYLAELAVHLREPARTAVTAEAITVAGEIAESYWRGVTLVAITPHVTEILADRVVAAAATLDSEAERVRVLSGLASYRDSVGARTLAEASLALFPDQAAVDALTTLVPHLPAEFFNGSLSSMIRTTDPDQNLDGLFRVVLDRLLILAAESSGDARLQLLGQAVELITAMRGSPRTTALARLAPQLPDTLLRELLASATKIADAMPRALVLAELASWLPEADRRAAVDECLTGLTAGAPSWDTMELLDALAPSMTRDHVDDAVAILRTGRQGQLRYAPLVRRLAALGEHQHAIELAQSADNPVEKIRLLASVADGQPDTEDTRVHAEITAALGGLEPLQKAHVLADLPASEPGGRWDAFLPQLESAVREISDPRQRVAILARLKTPPEDPELIAGTVRELLSAARESPPNLHRAELLIDAARLLAEPDRQAAYVEALTYLEPILDSLQGTHTDSLLARCDLPPTLLGQVLAISDENARSIALRYVAPRLPEPLLRVAMAAAEEFVEGYWKEEALSAMLIRLAELGHVEESVNQMSSLGRRRGRALQGIVPLLSPSLLASISDVSDFGEASGITIAILIREIQLGAATATFERVAAIDNDKHRAKVLKVLAEHLRTEPPRDVDEHLVRLMRLLSRRLRSGLLSDLGTLAPLIAHVGGPDAVAGVIDAIVETTSWFP